MAPESSIFPATQAVLFNSDLQVKIFETSSDETAAHCALVCKGWTENALDHAWHRITSFRQLFNVLAPLTPPESSRDNGFDFLRPIRTEDRLRLNYYSIRIRHLDIPPLGGHVNRRDLPCDSALNELLSSSHGPSILPKLVKIFSHSWGAMLTKVIVPFLHPGLEDLSLIWTDNGFKPEFFKFLEELESRSARLKKLFLDVPENSTVALERVSQLVSKQTSLEKFCQSGASPLSLLSALSRLPELNFLALSPVEADNMQTTACVPCQSGVCFPSLHRLSLNTTLSNAADFISSHPSFSKLTEMKFYAHRAGIFNTIEDFRKLFTVVSKSCPCLEVLRTDWRGAVQRINEYPPVTCDSFAPVASCRKLRVLSLYVERIELDDEELVDLLAHFPPLEILTLHSYSHTYSHAPTPFILHRIAEVQPDLHRLSLRLVEESAVTEQFFLDMCVPFRRLGELRVGFCRVVNANRMALYLSHILPPECKISTSHYAHNDTARKQWEIVESRIPFLRPWSPNLDTMCRRS